MKIRICPKCKVSNVADSMWCSNCGSTLSSAKYRDSEPQYANPDVCWFCETRARDSDVGARLHRVERKSVPFGFEDRHYRKIVPIPRCRKCEEERDALVGIRPAIRDDVKAMNPRPKKQFLFLLGIPVSILASFILVRPLGLGSIGFIPCALSILCIVPILVSFEQHGNRIRMKTDEQIEHYKNAQGFQYKNKDMRTHPEVITLTEAGWHYEGAGPAITVKNIPENVY